MVGDIGSQARSLTRIICDGLLDTALAMTSSSRVRPQLRPRARLLRF
jgi:hypothetical protein